MSAQELELSPAERRVLRKTFYRHAFPWLAVALGVCVFSLSGDEPEPPAPVEIPVPAEPRPLAEEPAFQELKAEIQTALGELQALGTQGKDEMNAAARQLASLEKRMKTAARRVQKLEEGLKTATTAAPSGAAGDASAWDVNAVMERLYTLEARQQKLEDLASSAPASGDLAGRLAEVEAQLGRLAPTPASPPAAAP